MVRAGKGVDIIIHAVNPSGYRNWEGLVLPMPESTIAAARVSGAGIVLPGTVYNFGPDAGEQLVEDAPQHPTTKKGRIRVALEERLREASRQGTRVLIVRAGDYFGPRNDNGWLAQVRSGCHRARELAINGRIFPMSLKR